MGGDGLAQGRGDLGRERLELAGRRLGRPEILEHEDERRVPPAHDGRSTRERITYVFEQLDQQAGAPEFQGCRYLAVQIELKDQSHPASRVAHEVKGNLMGFFRSEAEQGGASDPALLARQLSLVFDGASARAGIQADNLTGLITPTVRSLLESAGMR